MRYEFYPSEFFSSGLFSSNLPGQTDARQHIKAQAIRGRYGTLALSSTHMQISMKVVYQNTHFVQVITSIQNTDSEHQNTTFFSDIQNTIFGGTGP